MPPSSSAAHDDGPLSQERHMMERIREKLERAQLRLARQHAAQSATPGSSRYYPPNYESARARTPAPAVQSVKLEEFSLVQQATYASQAPPPSSSASGFLGVYPPPHASSRRPTHAYASRRAPLPPPTAASPATNQLHRPSRQSVPADDGARRESRTHHQPQHVRYPPALQYKSASRNTSQHARDRQGTPLSTAAPFLVYASATPRPSVHDRLKEPPASALRSVSGSAWQPPPSSRVRFQGDHDDDDRAEKEERARVEREKLARAEKARERQKEKELALREMLANERKKRAEAEQKLAKQSHQSDGEKTRRGSLPTPPKSEIDATAVPFPLSPTTSGTRPRRNSIVGGVTAPPQSEIDASATRPRRNSLVGVVVPPKSEIDASAALFPLSPTGTSGTRPRRNSVAGSVVPPPTSEIDARMFQPLPSPRNRRSSTTAAVPPASAIQASAFDDAPVRRRSAAADELKHRAPEVPEADKLTPTANTQQPVKPDTPSDEDEFTTPPTSPSSGGSSSATARELPRATTNQTAKMAAPLFDLVAAAPEVPKHAPEERIAINVKLVTKDYDDALLLSNQPAESASPSTKLKQLSIWEEDDEEEIIAPLNQRPSPTHQQQTQTPKGDRRPALIWDDGDELDDSDDDEHHHQQQQQQRQPEEDPLSSQEPSPAKTNALPTPTAPNNQAEAASPQRATATEGAQKANPTRSVSPARSPVGSRVPGSRPRPDLRSRISAALQAFTVPEPASPVSPVSPPTERRPLGAAPPASSRPPAPPMSRTPVAVASAPRPTAPAPPSAVPRPPSTTVGRPSVTRPRTPLPPPPTSSLPHAYLMPPSSRASTTAAGSSQRRVRHREPLELKMQLPPQIGVLAGLSSGPITFPFSPTAFYEIEWRTGEFGFSFQRVYTEECSAEGKSEMFLRMLLDTDRGTCSSFRDVHVGDILIQIGDVKVSALGFDSARDPSTALTKYFTELRMQTPMRLVFQRMEVLDWEGGVEL